MHHAYIYMYTVHNQLQHINTARAQALPFLCTMRIIVLHTLYTPQARWYCSNNMHVYIHNEIDIDSNSNCCDTKNQQCHNNSRNEEIMWFIVISLRPGRHFRCEGIQWSFCQWCQHQPVPGEERVGTGDLVVKWQGVNSPISHSTNNYEIL